MLPSLARDTSTAHATVKGGLGASRIIAVDVARGNVLDCMDVKVEHDNLLGLLNGTYGCTMPDAFSQGERIALTVSGFFTWKSTVRPRLLQRRGEGSSPWPNGQTPRRGTRRTATGRGPKQGCSSQAECPRS